MSKNIIKLTMALLAVCLLIAGAIFTTSHMSTQRRIVITQEHKDAVNKIRRIIVNCDAIAGYKQFATANIKLLKKRLLGYADMRGSQIDSIWWNWGEGNQAPYPSDILPPYNDPGFMECIDNGVDFVEIFLKETHRLGLESFFSYRINGGDNDLGPIAEIPIKKEHPEWLISSPLAKDLYYFNYSIPEVRQYKLSVLKEIAVRYDFDGMEIDFARGPITLPPGKQWEYKDRLTSFIRSVRQMLIEEEEKRGRPYLLAVRIPENIVGCHYDGIDIETWVNEELVDILVLGVRSFEVDFPAFKQLVKGSHVKLYPCFDFHHSSDGYYNAKKEIIRGAFATWLSQGADGAYTFNWSNTILPDRFSKHYQNYKEIGSLKTLHHKNKIFVVGRKGGGGLVATPEKWATPRFMYFNTNMFAPLPASIDNNEKVDTFFTIYIADDVQTESKNIKKLSLSILLSDPGAKDISSENLMNATGIRDRDPIINMPPEKSILQDLQVRINGILLKDPAPTGWLIYTLKPEYCAVGDNLISIAVRNRAFDEKNIIVEKIEIDVIYTYENQVFNRKTLLRRAKRYKKLENKLK